MYEFKFLFGRTLAARSAFFNFRTLKYLNLKKPIRVSTVSNSTSMPVFHIYSSRCYSIKSSNSRLGVVMPQFLQAHSFLDRVGIVDQNGGHRYRDLIVRANTLADKILEMCGGADSLNDERICILCRNDVSYVVTLWATWIAGGVAVPLSTRYPAPQLHYFVEDSSPKLIITYQNSPEAVRITAKDTGVPLMELSEADYTRNDLKVTAIGKYSLKNPPNVKLMPGQLPETKQTNDLDLASRLSKYAARWNHLNQIKDSNKFLKRPALFIYTSGTTGWPKGVVHTYGSLHAQISCMSSSWAWSGNDVMLHCLPLHHVHGIVNALLTPLQHGACCVMLEKFDAESVWKRLMHPLDYNIHDGMESADGKENNPSQAGTSRETKPGLPRHVNMFTAVPTVYAKLIDVHNKRDESTLTKEYVKATCSKRVRLFMSGSAPLPLPILEQWENITGHRLLERYGMSELGMALTNPLEGVRVPGAVGRPFPHVEVRIVKQKVYKPGEKEEIEVITQGDCRTNEGRENEDGELQVRGATLFKEYWRKPEATRESFTTDGWFRTGDTAIFENGAYRIIGRTSVDIIKSGGYKIGALEVEQQILAHPDVAEVVVVGVPDMTWGQVVAAALVLKSGRTLTAKALKDWAAERLPPYQVPQVIKIVDSITRNAMGKVNKKQIVAEMFGSNKGVTKSTNV